MPKQEGGLGLRNNKIRNSAILLKMLWNIHQNKDSLWIKWVHGYYLKGKNVWKWECKNNDHPLFKKLGKTRNFIIQRTGYVSSAIQFLNSCSNMNVLSVSKIYEWMWPKAERRAWMSLTWRKYIPPKHSFVLWLCMRGRLYTLDKWKMELDDRKCVFCKVNLENVAHLFFQMFFCQSHLE